MYSHFNQTFDHNQFKAAVATLNASAASWLGTDGKYVRHKVMPTSSHCDLRQPVFKGLQAGLEQVAPYPGGSTRSPGDFSKQMADLAAAVTGPGSGSAILPTVLAQQALAQGLGMARRMELLPGPRANLCSSWPGADNHCDHSRTGALILRKHAEAMCPLFCCRCRQCVFPGLAEFFALESLTLIVPQGSSAEDPAASLDQSAIAAGLDDQKTSQYSNLFEFVIQAI